MMLGFGVLRLALLTSIIYVAWTVVIELGIFAVVRLTGSAVTVIGTKGAWWCFFALLWLASFSIAWHFAPMFPRK